MGIMVSVATILVEMVGCVMRFSFEFKAEDDEGGGGKMTSGGD
jgi:hypothetical protein